MDDVDVLVWAIRLQDVIAREAVHGFGSAD
jgi:hypothetical protein